MIDAQIRELEILYKRAQKSNKNASRYNLRLKISMVSGVKMMYYHYATSKREEINQTSISWETIGTSKCDISCVRACHYVNTREYCLLTEEDL